ncbi:GNAT family N-acetyltransferase [Streptomyces sp. NPDC006208]|uniref:GNAT family N-acetyltransferase n=1 Tax=Streptomyces sp. NPDC006208 TaxID=3156734 RepID=UPI0033A26654
MDYGIMDRDGRRIALCTVDDDNWRAVADIAPRDDQRAFVAALAARYLLLSMRGGVWHSLGVQADKTMVGHVMWAYGDENGSHWIGGMVVDAAEQGKGVGRQTMVALIRWLSERADCQEIRLSYHPDNTAASNLYTSLGFVHTGEFEDAELVVALQVGAPGAASA